MYAVGDTIFLNVPDSEENNFYPDKRRYND